MMDDAVLSVDERSALRAYLQRSEVRLSTIHRTATALLSGAGVLVLLPAVSRDSVVNVMSRLLGGSEGPLQLTLAGLVVLTLALTFIVIWLLLLEITRFYFHANHFTGQRGTTFTPRFTLTSLHLAVDELGPAAREGLARRRNDEGNIELLVPANDTARRQIDAQIDAYGIGDDGPPTDASRARARLLLAGVKDRTLLDEVAKVEYGMARHVLRVEVIVLRYIKALLVVLTTTLTTFVMAAALDSATTVDTSGERWVVATLMLWAPAVLFVTSTPVRWLGKLLVTEGATTSGIRYDKDLTHLERVASVFSVVVLVGAFVCGLVLLTRDASTVGRVAFAAVGLVGCATEAWLLRAIRR
jgi:hypothetical protein